MRNVPTTDIETSPTRHSTSWNYETPDLGRVISVLRDRWGIPAFVAATAAMFAMAYLLMAVPSYEAQVRLVIQDRGLNLGTPAPRSFGKEFLTTQSEVIRSPLVIKQALTQIPGGMAGGSAWTSADTNPVEIAIEQLRVNPLVSSDIVRVTFRDSIPERAVQMLEAIVTEYQNRVHHDEQRLTSQSLELLTEREKDLRKEIQQKHVDLTTLRARRPLVGDGREAMASEQLTLKALGDRLTTARSKRLQLEQLIQSSNNRAQVAGQDSLAAFDTTFERELAATRQQLLTAQAELEASSQTYTANHPERMTLEKRVTALQSAYRLLQNDAAQHIHNQLQASRAEEESLQTLLHSEHQRLKNLDEVLVDERQMLAELDRLEKVHAASLSLLESSNLSDRALVDGRSSITVQVLDEFKVPDDKVWPKPIPLLALATLFGLGLGVGLVLAIEFWPDLPIRTTSPFQSPEIPVADYDIEVPKVTSSLDTDDMIVYPRDTFPQSNPQPSASASSTAYHSSPAQPIRPPKFGDFTAAYEASLRVTPKEGLSR